MKNLLNYIILLTFGLFTTPLYSLSSDWAIGDKSKVRLISPYTTSNNTNEFILGLEYQLDQDWKTYWKSPGGGGFPQKIIWNNSSNISNLTIEWPQPIEFEILGLSSIGYKDNIIFPLIIKTKNKEKITNVNLNINYLVCKDICIPGNANLFLDIPAGDGKPTEYLHAIEKVKSSTSIKNIELSPITEFKVEGKSDSKNVLIDINVTTKSLFNDPKIFIHTPFGLPIVQPNINYSLDYKKINSTFQYDIKQFEKNKFPIEVFFYDKNINYIYQNSIDIKKVNYGLKTNKSLFFILLVSIVGGLILNFMPCVFPVLSIKLLSVLNTDKRQVRLSFIITSLGIISSFLLLGLFFSILKQLNISISWGMQFQEPYFILFILIVITLFFQNTLGLFEINLPRFFYTSNILGAGGNFFSKNFFNGFFATLLATPCSAPYIGTAITAAFTQSMPILLLIFLFMGIGMSTPYLLIIIFPKLISYIPKSGAWTKYFKYFLSLLLFLTILWLLNILLGYYNYLFIVSFLIIFFSISLVLKLKFYQTSLTIILLSFLFILPSIEKFKDDKILLSDSVWKDFNKVDISKMISDDKLIFLDITADWCITCQFNKINVINSEETVNYFKNNNIVLVKADWTKPNNNIDAFLKKYNKFGIPFNAIYSSEYPNGIILPEILSQKEIIKNLERASE